MSWIAVLTRTN